MEDKAEEEHCDGSVSCDKCAEVESSFEEKERKEKRGCLQVPGNDPQLCGKVGSGVGEDSHALVTESMRQVQDADEQIEDEYGE